MVQLLVMSIEFTCRYSSTWCHKDDPGHGTRIARGVPLPVYMNLLGLHLCIVVFDVLLIVLCFVIVYLLSRVRSLGRCF